MSATVTELAVPMEAVDALEAADLTYTDTTPEAEVRAVAIPVVTAELLALAEPLEEFIRDSEAGVDQRDKVVAYRDGLTEAVRRLRERVAELTGEKP